MCVEEKAGQNRPASFARIRETSLSRDEADPRDRLSCAPGDGVAPVGAVPNNNFRKRRVEVLKTWRLANRKDRPRACWAALADFQETLASQRRGVAGRWISNGIDKSAAGRGVASLNWFAGTRADISGLAHAGQGQHSSRSHF